MKLPTLEEMREELLEGDNPLDKDDADLTDARFVRAYYALRMYQKLHPKINNKDLAMFVIILFNSYQLSLKDILDVNKIIMAWTFDINGDDPEFKKNLRQELHAYLDEIYDLRSKIFSLQHTIDEKKIH